MNTVVGRFLLDLFEKDVIIKSFNRRMNHEHRF
jgi:hypothetical protein